MKKLVGTLSIAMLLYGCSRSQPDVPAREESPPPQKSTAQTLVDGFTGRTAVQAGKKARRTIEEVSAQENENLNEVMGND